MKEEVEVKVGGVSTFFYFAIPAVLALAAIWWLAFGEGLHSFNRQVSQEDRAAQAVGAAPLPKAAINVVIKNKHADCHVIDKAVLDGGDLWIYWHNACSEPVKDSTIAWSSIAPDGTMIKSGWDYTHQDLDGGQKAEYHFSEVDADPRTVTLEVKARWNDQP